ncbi:MAG: urate hydroxylase PuuD, partial [Devosia sp.]|nr:urate hydroxylase PuuD [Devosia sp.]
IIAWLSSEPRLPGSAGEEVASRAAEPFLQSQHFAQASLAVQTRCAMCHTAEPAWPGIYEAPKDVILDNDIAIANNARAVAMQAGYSHAMPPGNVSEMTPQERALLVEWFREGSAR